MRNYSSLSLVFAVFAISLVSSTFGQDLDYQYYKGTCDDFEEIVARKVREWYNNDPTIAPSLLRLHFHDCAVRGCDASILLNYQGSERTSKSSATLRGFNIIDEIKHEIERKCPSVVSCADILTAAARDATVLLKGPFWSNQYGRKDGRISVAAEADSLPQGYEDVTTLVEFFQSLGLNTLDLVILSGAHTVGRCSCASFQDRLYNYQGSGKPDYTLDPKYLDYLRRKCKNNGTQLVDLDPITPNKFDNQYYSNINKYMGLLKTDQELNNDHRTEKFIDLLASQPQVFYYEFASSMVKLGNIVGDDDDDGEIRHQCSYVNY